jgi:hypothetical protein
MIGPIALLAGLAIPIAQAAPDDYDFELEGHYRTRAHLFKDLYAGQEGDGRYMTHRLRMEPTFNFEERAKFMMQVDVLDGAVWGDNQSQTSTALFAGAPSATGIEGTAEDTFQLKRAWMEFKIPLGVIRIGRQPSDWGMGLLANDGNGFDDLFGENKGGSTYDRFIFATKPLAIAQSIAGREPSDFPLFLAVGVDRLVEDPLIQYHGFACEPGLVEGVDDGYSAACDSRGDGVTDLTHGITDDRLDSQRKDDWWVDGDDDVMEMIYVLIYKGEGLSVGSSTMDLTAGTYVVNRMQPETDSNITIVDAYLRFMWSGLYLEAEALHIAGETSAIALPGAFDAYAQVADPLAKEADIWGYVVKGGLQGRLLSLIMEHGYASGDEDATDTAFTGRPLHPDHNVGLLLYEEILARVTATSWTESAEGLWSQGGVYNSRYFYPHIRWRPMDNWEVSAAYLVAFPDKPDGVRIRCAEGDDVECAIYDAEDKALGTEFDIGLKHRFHNHVDLTLEAGWARTTDRIPVENYGLNPDGKFFTLQSRVAFLF